jgi:aryl-alcohol dehydrogenase-like predicted oxidoreductase
MRHYVPHVCIPHSDLAITRLAFGCARIFGGSEARASARLIETALDVGIRHFDTAPAYSHGQSEEVLGAVLAGVSDATIATKVGIPLGEGKPSPLSTLYRRTFRPALARVPALKLSLLKLLVYPRTQVANNLERRLLSKDEILESLEGSLKRLRRSRVDIFLIHEPDGLDIDDEAQEVFVELNQRGLTSAFGMAWGRAVDQWPPFGQVIQSQYDPGTASSPTHKVTRLFHGVLRQAKPRRISDGESAVGAHCVRYVLETHPTSSIIFSASHPTQIRNIARIVNSEK